MVLSFGFSEKVESNIRVNTLIAPFVGVSFCSHRLQKAIFMQKPKESRTLKCHIKSGLARIEKILVSYSFNDLHCFADSDVDFFGLLQHGGFQLPL